MKSKGYSRSYVRNLKRELKRTYDILHFETRRADEMAKRLSLQEYFVAELTKRHPRVARGILKTHG